MGQISKELSMVFDNACKIYYDDCCDIDCMNLLLAMAITVNSFSAEILLRHGFNESIARSFIIEYKSYEQRNISQNAEKAIHSAGEIAKNYGYEITCSHHLLLAIVENYNNEMAQILKDYNITKLTVGEVVEAMCYNGIGKDAAKNDENKHIKLSPSIKNKELEKEILSALRKNGFKP